jgi:hypothetical protein
MPACLPRCSFLSCRSLSDQQWSQGELREIWARRQKLLLYLIRSPCLETLVK